MCTCVDGRGRFHYPRRVSTASLQRYHSSSPEETLSLGRRFGAAAASGAVVLLVGPLGAGKTVLAKGFASGLGIHDEIISPTYTIISEYREGAVHFYHVDLYRVDGRDQIENLGLEDLLGNDAVVLIEWGEKVEGMIGGARTRMTLALADDGGRDILVEELTGWMRRVRSPQ